MISLAVLMFVMAPVVLTSWFFAWWLLDQGARSQQRHDTAIVMVSARPVWPRADS